MAVTAGDWWRSVVVNSGCWRLVVVGRGGWWLLVVPSGGLLGSMVIGIG